jgi:molybdate-binding protein/DNA-binding XRE family transcriptional regulator
MTAQQRMLNHVRAYRMARGWSQEDLAEKAAISRASVSAIEMERLVPSAAAALTLAAAFQCRVEDLFELTTAAEGAGRWAWPPPRQPWRYWHAQVAGKKYLYPVEWILAPAAHDGIFQEDRCDDRGLLSPSQTLVLACCDPAVGLLADEYRRIAGFRILAFQRSSGEALALLSQGLVHVAGIHLERCGQSGRNRAAAQEHLREPFCLLRAAHWQEGLATAPRRRLRSVEMAVAGRLRWVGRESGSAACELQQEILSGRVPKHVARGHYGVAEAVRAGWADVGVCVRLVSDEAGLDFLAVRDEAYDLCFPTHGAADPRIQALVQTVQSPAYRALVRDLPGYDVAETGMMESLDAPPS